MDAARLLGVFIIAGTVVGSPFDSASHALAAGQSGWSSNPTSPPTASYDRYGQPVTNGAPSTTQRAQAAFNDSSAAIRDGVESGIRSANDQITRTASGAGTQLNQQVQNWSNSAANGMRSSADQAVNSFTNSVAGTVSSGSPSKGNVTSPWPTSSAAHASSATGGTNGVMSTNGGWTSIGSGIAAPPLLIPKTPMSNSGMATNLGAAGGAASRPTFPVAATNESPKMHSVLSDPARSEPHASSNGGSNDWINNWNNQSNLPPSIGKTGNQMGSTVRESDLVPLQGNSRANSDPQNVTTARQTDNWSDSWGQTPASAAPATINSTANRQGNVSSPFANQPNSNQANGQFAGGSNVQGPALGGFTTPINNAASSLPNNQMTGNALQTMNGQVAGGAMPNGQLGGNAMTNAMGPNPMGTSQMGNVGNQGGRGQSGNGQDQQPWVPLIAAVLVMAFSLAANLYLGVSYLDARQKYQSLVRKTAETFRRVKAAA